MSRRADVCVWVSRVRARVHLPLTPSFTPRTYVEVVGTVRPDTSVDASKLIPFGDSVGACACPPLVLGVCSFFPWRVCVPRAVASDGAVLKLLPPPTVQIWRRTTSLWASSTASSRICLHNPGQTP